MLKLKRNRQTIAIIVAVSSVSFFIIQPVLSHRNHQHNTANTESIPKQETTEKVMSPMPDESAKTTESKAENSLPVATVETANVSHFLIPRPSELLLLLLIINPFLLYLWKRNFYFS